MSARSHRILALALLGLAAGAGCGDFEVPEIVLDLRILGLRAEPPEVVVAIEDPQDFDLSQVPEVEVCALIADPTESRRLVYDFIACPPTRNGRCDDPEAPVIQLGNGLLDDPEEAASPPEACGTLVPTPTLLDVIERSMRDDPLGGFDGVAVQVQLAVRPEGGDVADTTYAVKEVFFADERPAGRRANRNPSLDGFTVAREANGERGRDFDLPLGRCADLAEPPVATPGEPLAFLPREPDGVREDYVLPTFDGGSLSFTENLRYAWFASTGSWNRFETGGPHDAAGNDPPLDSTWTAPGDPDRVGDGLDVDLWIVQRDERGGQSYYQSCVRVEP